jgi:hypothetical protein
MSAKFLRTRLAEKKPVGEQWVRRTKTDSDRSENENYLLHNVKYTEVPKVCEMISFVNR